MADLIEVLDGNGLVGKTYTVNKVVYNVPQYADIYNNKDALQTMVLDTGDGCAGHAWAEVSKDCEHREEFKHAVLGTAPRAAGRAARAPLFSFADLKLGIQLVQPISDGIHELEADKPRLSYMLPFFVALFDHARAFDAEHSTAVGTKVLPIFKARFDKHYDKAWAAAFLVDPIFASQGSEGWYLPFSRKELSNAKVEDALQCLQELAGTEHRDAVAAEFTRLRLSALPQSMARDLPFLTARTKLPNGRETVVTTDMRRTWWDINSHHFPLISQAAIRLLSFHVTSCATERNWSRWGQLCTKASNRRTLERSEKLVTIMSSKHNVEGGQDCVDDDDDDVMLKLLEAE